VAMPLVGVAMSEGSRCDDDPKRHLRDHMHTQPHSLRIDVVACAVLVVTAAVTTVAQIFLTGNALTHTDVPREGAPVMSGSDRARSARPHY
jgi:hypothetical protein